MSGQPTPSRDPNDLYSQPNIAPRGGLGPVMLFIGAILFTVLLGVLWFLFSETSRSHL